MSGRYDGDKVDSYIRIRVPSELKEDFFKACDLEAANASEVLRRLIIEYIEHQMSKVKI